MMELKVLNNTLTAYSGRWETRLELPVEAEILIPDYLPAVFKIVKCRLEPVVLHNELAGGVNSRLDEIQAALLRAKLPHVGEVIAQRESVGDERRGVNESLCD